MKQLVPLVLSSLAIGVLMSQALPQPTFGPNDQPEPFPITVDVELVVMPVSVSDAKGRPVAGLGSGNFEVYQNGVRQQIQLFRHDDVPVTLGLIVDHSGSMAPKLPAVALAARAFATASDVDDEMFVINFNEQVSLDETGGKRFTNSADDVERAIVGAPTTGMTALYDAVLKGLRVLQEGSRERKVLVVISDGSDNASTQTLASVSKLAERLGAVVYAVGTFDRQDPDRNPGVLRRLARATGGEAFFPAQLDDVAATCQRIAEDIRNQYTIGFLADSAANPGAYRKLRVMTKVPGTGKLVVRTRAGYVAGDFTQSAGAK